MSTKKDIESIIEEILFMPLHSPDRYETDYYLTTDKEDLDAIEASKKTYKNTNRSCFANLLRELTVHKKYNRMLYKIVLRKAVDKETRIEWVNLCREHKLLPNYIEKENAISGRLVIYLDDKNLNPSLLYIYLSVFRCLFEDTSFVKAVLALVNKHKVNFFVAWTFASAFHIHNGGHSIIGMGRSYCKPKSLKDAMEKTVPLSYMIGLSTYIANPKKYDDRSIRDIQSGFGSSGSIYKAACGVNALVKFKDMYNISIEPKSIPIDKI